MKRIFIIIFVAMLFFALSGCKHNPVPTLSSILPSSKVAHLPTFILDVIGTGFVEDSQIFFNGIAKMTTYVSATELTCEINPGDIEAGPASLPVMVSSPSPGGGDSNTINFTVLSNHQFTTPLMISYTDYVLGDDIAVDNSGRIYVVWQYDNYWGGGDGRAYFTRSDDGGTVWTDAFNIYNGTLVPWCPEIAVDSMGNINVVGEHGDSSGWFFNVYFMRSTNSGSDWSIAKTISGDLDPGDSWQPRIALDSSDNINVIWAGFPDMGLLSDRDIHFTRSTNSGNDWSSAVNISNSASLGIASETGDITVDQADNINVVWYEYESPSDYSVKFSRSTNSGGTWPSVETVAASTGNIGGTRIAVDSSGNINVLWSDKVSGEYDVYFSRSENEGVTWSTAVNISNNTVNSFGDIAVDGAGNINIVYSGIGVRLLRSTNGGATWSSAVVVSNSHYGAEIALDSAGNIYLLMFQNMDLYFSRSGV